MKNEFDAQLNSVLASTEYPGEDEAGIAKYIKSVNITNNVMHGIALRKKSIQKTIFWALFAVANLLFLYISGTDSSIVSYYVKAGLVFTSLFYLFIGLTFIGAVFGLIMNLDTSWVHKLLLKIIHYFKKQEQPPDQNHSFL